MLPLNSDPSISYSENCLEKLLEMFLLEHTTPDVLHKIAHKILFSNERFSLIVRFNFFMGMRYCWMLSFAQIQQISRFGTALCRTILLCVCMCPSFDMAIMFLIRIVGGSWCGDRYSSCPELNEVIHLHQKVCLSYPYSIIKNSQRIYSYFMIVQSVLYVWIRLLFSEVT